MLPGTMQPMAMMIGSSVPRSIPGQCALECSCGGKYSFDPNLGNAVVQLTSLDRGKRKGWSLLLFTRQRVLSGTCAMIGLKQTGGDCQMGHSGPWPTPMKCHGTGSSTCECDIPSSPCEKRARIDSVMLVAVCACVI